MSYLVWIKTLNPINPKTYLKIWDTAEKGKTHRFKAQLEVSWKSSWVLGFQGLGFRRFRV